MCVCDTIIHVWKENQQQYQNEIGDPAVHCLVPEFDLLWPGLAGPVQGRAAGCQRFVTACL